MTIRVKRADGEWDEIATGTVDYHERGGALHVRTDTEPVFYDADAWTAFEVVGADEPVIVTTDGDEERVFPDGFA